MAQGVLRVLGDHATIRRASHWTENTNSGLRKNLPFGAEWREHLAQEGKDGGCKSTKIDFGCTVREMIESERGHCVPFGIPSPSFQRDIDDMFEAVVMDIVKAPEQRCCVFSSLPSC